MSAGEVGVRVGQGAVRDPVLHGRAVFQGQAVHRHVRRRELAGALQSAPPLFESLVGQPVHQVDAHVVEAGVRGEGVCVGGLLGRVPSPEQPQQSVVESLHADAQAVDAAAQVCRQLALAKVAGIGLECDLGVRAHPERATHRGHHLFYAFGGQIRGSAAAEEHAGQRRAAQGVAPHGDFPAQCVAVRRNQRLNGRVGVEVAVGALGLAEGYVDVEGERGCGGMAGGCDGLRALRHC